MLFRLLGMFGLMIALVSGVAMAQETRLNVDEPLLLASDIGRVSAPVPEGWQTMILSDTTAYAGTSDDVLYKPLDEAFQPGEVRVYIATLRASVYADVTGLNDAEKVEAIVEALLALPTTTGALPQSLNVTTVGDVPVASAQTKTVESASYALVRMVSDKTFLFMEIVTASNDLQSWMALGDEIMAGVRLHDESIVSQSNQTTANDSEQDTAFVLSETYSADDLVFSIHYPAGWVTRPSFPNGVAIGTSEAALDLWHSHAFGPDDAHAFIGFGTSEEMFELSSTTPLSPLEIFEITIDAEGLGDEQLEIDGPYALTIGERDAAYVTLTQPESQTYLLIVDYGDDRYLVADIQTGVGSVEAMADLLLAMVETVQMSDALPTAKTGGK